MICALCGRQMTTNALVSPNLVRKSKSREHASMCIECVNPHIHAVHRPRYCDCEYYHRDPDLPEQCLRCLRRINPRYDIELIRT